jgi:hypothetical protein
MPSTWKSTFLSAIFQHLLEQPHTGQLAADDPRNFFYIPHQAEENQ